MSIENRLETAFKALISKEWENALIQISIAIDAWSKELYSINKVGKRIKRFVRENTEAITTVTLFGASFPRATFPQGDFEDIVYKGIRCSLLHSGKLAKYITIAGGSGFSFNNNKFVITTDTIWGLFLAIITSDINKSLNIPNSFSITIYNYKTVPLKEFQGNIEVLKKVYRSKPKNKDIKKTKSP